MLNIMKNISILILFLLLLFQYNLPGTLHAKSTIKVGIYNNEPLIFVDADGKGKGFFADILEYIASEEEWQIEYVPGSWQQCLSRLENNQIDILCVIAFSKARDKLYDFNKENLLTNWGQLYTSLGSGIKAITDVAGKKVAVLKNDIHYEIFVQTLDSFGIKTQILEMDDYHSVLESVSTNQADAGVVNRFFGMKYSNKYHVDKSGVIFNPIKIHFAFPEGKNKKLSFNIDRHISLLKENEESIYYKSLDKWFSTVSPVRVFPVWVKWAFFITLGFVILLFLVTLVLRSRIKAKTKDLISELKLRNLAEENLRYRSILETMIAKISTLFVSLEKVDYSAILQMMGESVGVNRAYIFQIQADGTKMSNTYEWCAQGIDPQIDSLQGLETSISPWWMEKLHDRKNLIIKNVKEMPKEASAEQKVLQTQQIQSLIVVPIWSREQTLWGFMGFDDTEKTREWSKTEIKSLQIVGELISSDMERKRTEKEKIQAQKTAEEQKKLAFVGQVAGKMAHDFNNILGIIMGNTEIALLDCKDAEVEKTLYLIFNQTIRGKNLTKNLVAFAKDQEPRQEFFRLNEKIDLVVSLLKKDLEKIEMVREDRPGVPDLVADPGMIEHALVNLIHNSIHALKKTEHPKIIIKTYCMDDNIYFEIQDNGCGIPKEHIENIYEPSFTLKGSKDATNSYERGIKGTGYGLANVKKYIDQHKGQIRAESEFGLGTKLIISLPFIRKQLTPEEKKEFTTSKIQSNKSILLVEDEQSISDVQYRILTQAPCNHKVDLAPNGQVALDLFNKNTYDLISLDYILPGKINGMDVYNYIRETNKNVPILFCSGNLEFLESIKDLKQKDIFIDHLSKPSQNKDYVNTINKLLETIVFI
jgi:signal transduction histidine kinase/ABC-type amino acid transport substrate-binding protein/CheY-like chemotaxis protein